MLNSATLGSQGVVGHLDVQVTATGVPSAGIIVTSGAVVVLGQEVAFQGSYYGFNVGNDTTLSIAATGGSARSDLIVVRAEDPTFAGSPWGGPASGQILFPRVISGVSSGTTVAPGGISAIALARIDVPASTSAITNAMIHDLRQVCNPQRVVTVNAVTGPGTGVNSPTSGTVTAWPPGATWQVQIPNWATSMVTSWSANELEYVTGTVRANLWPVFGASVTAPVLSMPQSLISMTATTGPFRHTIGGAGVVAIPASMRGTTQTLQFAYQTAGQVGTLQFNEAGSVSILTEFQQLAAAA
jgi:hypothetical protein